jgi:flagellar L-ring protein precursor FlgH
MKSASFMLAALAMISGCATVEPTTITQYPTSARPQPVAVAAPSNGAIFQPGAYRPMFEDYRARHVGDTLTIRITENSNANKKSSNESSKSGSASASIERLFGVQDSTLDRFGVAASNSREFENNDASSSQNNFNSTLTATVIEVLPNGNLVVAGEKQVALDAGIEYIRFSGVVNPRNINASNSVTSTQIADVRAEYRSSAQVDKSQIFSALTRFFLSVLPL